MAHILRPFTLDDVDALLDLINACEHDDGAWRVLELEELVEELGEPHIDLARDMRVVDGADGRLLGWARADHRPSGEIAERAQLMGGVDPQHRGQGIGRALIEWSLDQAVQRLLAIDNELPKFVRVYSSVELTDAHRLVARFGLTEVRWFDELLMPLDRRPSFIEPSSVAIVAWPRGSAGDELTRQVKNTAFLDHWGSVPTAPAEWHHFLYGYGSRLDLSFVAIDRQTDEMVAICHCGHYPADEAVLGRRDGWIQTLGTLPNARGQGIGSALICRALQAFAEANLTHASIGVDSDNPSGASRLYRSLGFQPSRREVAAELHLA